MPRPRVPAFRLKGSPRAVSGAARNRVSPFDSLRKSKIKEMREKSLKSKIKERLKEYPNKKIKLPR